MSKLVNLFAAGSASLFLAGCGATISGDCMGGTNIGLISTRTFSTKCADNKVANTMLQSGRPDLQLVGATMLRNQSPSVDRAFDDVKNGKGAPAPVQASGNCVVTGISESKRKDGPKTAQLSCN